MRRGDKQARYEKAVRRKSLAWLLLAAAAALAGAISLWRVADDYSGIDFYQFWLGGRAAAGEVENVYDVPQAARFTQEYLERARKEEPTWRRLRVAKVRLDPEFYSTPVLYTAFSLFPRTSYELAYHAYTALGLAMSIIALVWIGRGFGISYTRSLWLVAFVFFAFESYQSEMRVANVNQLQLLIVAALLAGQRTTDLRLRFAIASLFGASLMFKPNIVAAGGMAVLVLLSARKWREAIIETLGYACGALLASIAAMIRFGTVHVWDNWYTLFRSMPDDVIDLRLGNIAIRGYLDSRIPYAGVFLGAAIVAAVVALSCFAAARSSEHRLHHVSSIAVPLGVAATFSLSGLVWLHYVILVLPLVWRLVAAHEIIARRPANVIVALGAVALLFLAFTPIAIPLELETVPQKMIVVNIGLMIAIAAAMRMLWIVAKTRS